jgi:chemotaxis-related protein WspD
MSEAASHLDQPISPKLRQEWALDMAKIAEAKRDESERKLFLFRLGAEWFGLDPVAFAATLPDARPRRLPHRRNALLDGVAVYDGRVLACLSLERFFKILPEAEERGTRRLLVLQWKDWTFATRVNEALGVEEIREAEISPLSQTASDLMRRCAVGVVLHRNMAVTCLDLASFFQDLEVAMQ